MLENFRAHWRRLVIAPLRRLLARRFLARGQVRIAESLLRHACADAPRSVTGHLLLGRTLLRLGKLDDALVAFWRAYQLDSVAFLSHALPPQVIEHVMARNPIVSLPEHEDVRPSSRPAWQSFPAEGDDPAPMNSDFIDGAEYRRFQSLASLANTDPATVDWDDLCDRLARPPENGDSRGPH